MADTRVYMIHGWGASPHDAWFPWLTKRLQAEGVEVFAPHMPDPEHPRIDLWVGFLDGMCIEPDGQTFFIGHSIGCQTIMRYLQILPEGVKVGGALYVAGWFNLQNLEGPEEEEIAAPWLADALDTDRIKEHGHAFYALLSDNDPFGSYEENKKGFEALGAKIETLRGAGHIDTQQKLPEAEKLFDQLRKQTSSL